MANEDKNLRHTKYRNNSYVNLILESRLIFESRPPDLSPSLSGV